MIFDASQKLALAVIRGRIVKPSGRSNTKPGGATETLPSLILSDRREGLSSEWLNAARLRALRVVRSGRRVIFLRFDLKNGPASRDTGPCSFRQYKTVRMITCSQRRRPEAAA